uniref:Uncharacterized protein n=1 Tax=Rhizophora mucronata TaxID=61149 RepID=A0A2P2R4M5_RHIMU
MSFSLTLDLAYVQVDYLNKKFGQTVFLCSFIFSSVLIIASTQYISC